MCILYGFSYIESEDPLYTIIFTFVDYMSCDLGRFSLFIIFGLFYCRTKGFRLNMEGEGTDIPWDSYTVKKYMNSYQALYNSLFIAYKIIITVVRFKAYLFVARLFLQVG
ncbi:hypothetical protein B5X24_HaOG200891 [Helicoverpa armigera]|uniref:Odorant receptor n=1 Tax=Helicoverpa armigera TaxID=29058 RepID=A0A2W1BL31_HELAM|nr:hypothetical protein B5X24_HaOG200891 [Helicoverpa armigera]